MQDLLFVSSKALKLLTQPEAVLLMALTAGVLLLWLGRARTGRWLVSLCTRPPANTEQSFKAMMD